MCCGNKRTALRSTSLTGTTPSTRQATPGNFRLPGTPQQSSGLPGMPRSVVALRYMQSSPIRVRGPITGRQYEFSATAPVQAVDPKDAPALLRTPFFRQRV